MVFLTSLFDCFHTALNWFVDSPIVIPFMAAVILIGFAGIILKLLRGTE